MRSILSNEKRCYMCGKTCGLERHHIFSGYANRKKSEKDGLWVWLCHGCHNEPPNGVHHNRERMEWLRQEGQKAFQREYPDRDFLKEYGRNWL